MTSTDEHDFVVLGDDDLSDYNAGGILPELPETIRKIQQWLRPTDFAADSSEYRKHLNSYVPGTGNWIQQTETYQTWHDSRTSSSLWVKAMPGAGKSVFAAMIANKLAQTERVPVLYFFFRQRTAKNHDPQYLVRDWLSQLLRFSPSLQSKLKRQMKARQSLEDISTDEFWHILIEAMASIPKVYCVADALDEMDISHLRFLDRLVELGKQQHSTIKVLMTSRPLSLIESKLRTPSALEISILQIRLQQNMVDSDIAVYVDHRLRQRSDVGLRDDVREKIRTAICTKGQGSFLYARLMMDKLLDNTTQISSSLGSSADLEQIMKKLSVSLEEMYNGMLLDHATRSGVSQELQVTILQWVTHSVRPLRLLELAAMIIARDDNDSNLTDTKALVRAACGPLLEILEDGNVSIIHHSFTEFLIDQAREETASTTMGNDQFPVIRSLDTNRLLALTCLNYLISGRLDEWKLETRMKFDSLFFDRLASSRYGGIKMRHPFLGYAASNICVHVAKLESSDKALFAALDDFMKPDNHAFMSWVDLTWTSDDIEGISPLHVAAFWGMVNYCEHLIELGQDINGQDAELRTPMSWASARGHANIVERLLQNGANASSDDRVGLKPLHYAAMTNHSAVVRQLLAAGVDPLTPRTKDHPGRWCGNSPSEIGHTPLMYACERGNMESVLEFMTYLSAKDLNRALGWAAKAGKSNVVIALLESPNISIDTTENDSGSTALFYAAKAQNPVMIQALLEKGADPNSRSKVLDEGAKREALWEALEEALRNPGVVKFEENRKATPLHALAGLRNNRSDPSTNSTLDKEDALTECCKLLIDAAGDVHAVDDNGRCPLHYSRSPALTSILLQHGAKTTAESKDGSTPLHFACDNMADEKVVELLVRHGADINAKRHVDGKTPLHLLVTHFKVHSLRNFLAYKPDVNAGDDVGNTPLHLAVEGSPGKDFIQALLDAGADPNKRNLNMDTPIHNMGQLCSSDIDVVSVLMNAVRVDLDAQTHRADSSGESTQENRDNALPVAKNADSSEVFLGEDKTVVHNLLGFGGILRPFFEIPEFLESLAAGCIDHEGQRKESNVASVLDGMGLADIMARDSRGLNVLHRLLQTDTLSGVAYMITFSAIVKDAPLLVHQKDLDGNTPLHYALRMQQGNYIWSIEALLEAGANPLQPDSSGNTALHHLAKVVSANPNELLEMQLFKKFVTLGVPINSRNETGETPLFLYAAVGTRAGGGLQNWSREPRMPRDDLGIFEEAGADFLARNNDMDSLLHIVAKIVINLPTFLKNTKEKELAECFRFIMERGCDPLAEDSSQRTALDVAAACGNDEILKLFRREEVSRPIPEGG